MSVARTAPKDFDPETAENFEDVSFSQDYGLLYVRPHANHGFLTSTDGEAVCRQR